MPAPENLTRQDLIYAAKALRQAARLDEKRAADPGFTSMRAVFERSAQEQDALAAKLDRIAHAMRSSEARLAPSGQL